MDSMDSLHCELVPGPLSPIWTMYASLTALFQASLIATRPYEPLRELLAHLWRVDLTVIMVCSEVVVGLIIACPSSVFAYRRN